jgi:putative DNA primase/helicase
MSGSVAPLKPTHFRKLATDGAKVDAVANNGLGPQPVEDGVILVQGSSLEPTVVDWLWLHWLALGKFHVLAGPPGQGKTTIALACAATVSSGGRWPDGQPCAPGNVLIWSGEDDPKDTLLPRLLAMDANVSRVYFISGTRIAGKAEPFDPARDMLQLLAEAERIGNVRLLIVDPVVSAVAGDSHKNTEVRRALQPLVDLAANSHAAVLGISHFTKGSTGRDPVERVTGSLAFGALARVVLCAVKVRTEDTGDRRVLARAKSNVGPDGGGFEYCIAQTTLPDFPEISASVIEWGQALAGTARELLADAETDSSDEGDEAHADSFLRGLLADGPARAKDIKADADGAGYAWRTVQRASQRIGVEKRKDGLRGGWVWALAGRQDMPRRREGAEDAKQNGVTPSARSVASSDDAEAF